MVDKVFDISSGASEKIIDAKDVSTLCQKPLAKVRAEKTCAAGHQNSLLQMHQAPIDSTYLLSRLRKI
jgi:hypothetical protein